MTFSEFNLTARSLASRALSTCCGSSLWLEEMLSRRPYANLMELHDAAEQIWQRLDRTDWLEAFSRCPRIGDHALGPWSRQEQASVVNALESIKATLRGLNAEYELRFGWIFIISASGKSAEDIQGSLASRTTNSDERELQITSEELAKIMHIRLDKLFDCE
ncbi:MAG: decarboxylase [Acidobacteriaceae bacterium]|nr:decarboxylase [Acidobacteriaceae bacterium]